ncbi:MAG: chorismate synthase, partial [Chloroflexi bacterium]|nr:chorismate synthase [Chloroflexota bacterium]
MNRLRLLTSGESHGPGMSGILDGLPAGLRVVTREVDRDLARRQHGYGSGRRMRIEQDRVTWSAGLRFGRTLGSPLAFSIPNKDWASWTERMSVEPIPAARRPKPITLARPGHADLAGTTKYDTGDIRDVLERASARSTAPRVAAGAVCRQLLAAAGVTVWSFVDQLGPIRAFGGVEEPVGHVPDGWWQRDRLDPTPLRCPDPAAEAAMIAEVDATIAAGDSIGGSFIVVVEGMPIGVGSNAEWDTRLDAVLAAAT